MDNQTMHGQATAAAERAARVIIVAGGSVTAAAEAFKVAYIEACQELREEMQTDAQPEPQPAESE